MEEFCNKLAVLCHGKDFSRYGECLEILYSSFEASEKYLGEVDPELKKDIDDMMKISREFNALLTDECYVREITVARNRMKLGA